MQTRDKAFDYRPGNQFERAYAREDFGRQKASADLLGAIWDHRSRLDH
jgi:hypothetical protein